MKKSHTFLIAILTCFIALISGVKVQAQVVPPAYENTAGTSSFSGPLATTARTYQLLIHSSQLTELIGQDLYAISWRLPASASSDWPPADLTISNYDIYLGKSVDPANRSLAFFANNFDGPKKQVRTGSLSIDSASYKSGNSPNLFGPEIFFQTPYLYTGGNLLIEIRKAAFIGTSRSVDALNTSTSGYGTDFSACWKSGDTATFDVIQGNFGIVKISGAPAKTLLLTSLIEGRYDDVSNLMVPDTAKVYLRNENSPFAIYDSAIAVLDANGNGTFYFTDYIIFDNKEITELRGIDNFYIELDHRNSINTWSSSPISIAPDTLYYDFTSSSAQAYGNNMELKGLEWTIFSGDVNKDDFVDLTDLGLVYNDASTFVNGYNLTDVNGDLLTDLTDLLIVYDNASKFVQVIQP